MKGKNDAVFSILLPSYTQTQPKDIDNMSTRTWVVPGEKVLIYIKVENYKSSYDSFSFFCSTIECNKRTFQKQTTQNSSEVNEHIDHDQVLHTKVITNSNIPNASPFRTSATTLYFPMKMTIPITDDSEVTIGAFAARGEEPITTLKCKTIHPFIIRKKLIYTPQNYIISLRCNVSLPEDFTENVSLLSTQLKCNENIISSYDIASNICIISPAEYNAPIANGDELSFVFTVKALDELGASMLAALPLSLFIQWRVSSLDFTTIYPFSTSDYDPSLRCADQNASSSLLSNIIISVNDAECDIMQKTVIPVTITKLDDKIKACDKSMKLSFECNEIQPDFDTFNFSIDELTSQQKVINFSFIPLVCGKHKLSIYATVYEPDQNLKQKNDVNEKEEQKTNYRSVFPIYINVIQQKK